MEQYMIENEIPLIKWSQTTPKNGLLHFIGPSNGGSKVRAELNRLEMAQFSELLCDLGDLPAAQSYNTHEILQELQEAFGLTVSCLSNQLPASAKDAYLKRFLNPAIIDHAPQPQFEEYVCIGIQKHMLPQNFTFEARKHIRLGALQADIERAEVLLRNTDVAWVDLNVLRLADNLGSSSNSTAGLSVEEFCTIARYIGASTKLKSVIVSGYNENQDHFGMSAKNIALFLYYLLEGLKIRRKEESQSEDFQEYTVVHDLTSSELVFLEDKRSGRWWIKVYSSDAEEDVKLPCTRLDYDEACNNQISERITSILALV